jgi:hypothetical protein
MKESHGLLSNVHQESQYSMAVVRRFEVSKAGTLSLNKQIEKESACNVLLQGTLKQLPTIQFCSNSTRSSAPNPAIVNDSELVPSVCYPSDLFH